MALSKDTPKNEDQFAPAREPGFYAGDSGPYATAEDAQAFIDGHLDGKGSVVEVSAAE